MSHLKGNYKISQKDDFPDLQMEESGTQLNTQVQQEFERRALEKLGGSIAFVTKSNTFVWSGGDHAAESESRADDIQQEFERRALEKLGGSIAFVTKRNTFVWSGDEK